jgi:glycosyltransferase involved in cell wall biosynthesis
LSARLSIVIPAHHEGPLVRESLEHMLRDAEAGEFEVIVVPNGCTDDTAEQAAAVPGVTVRAIAEPSKTAALNAGDAVATVFPRAYIDADVTVDTATLRALASLLTERAEPCVAAPLLVVDASRSTLPVRQYNRVWAESEYRRSGHVGSGIYAVNRAGRERWGAFPDVVADDRFVQQRFHAHERLTVDGQSFTVHAPKDMSALVSRATRIEMGNRALPATLQLAAQLPAGSRYSRLLQRVLRSPRLWLAFPFYAYGHALPKLHVRRAVRSGTDIGWSRDESLRQAARA